ncbi:hypothetical protein T440DRAFT_279770 [Plenodomus tracheiphilus IPT5]|uniref:Uncharacterized protein n=1 Tax=Plenodomus tracheiphilus IPT5 TaxID=1408161 RepID=A0A6A7APX2_9PLEO|nr:hypothetical protein T440DRAFT_279770 [Plenodomus tracheiphilus IPT5]
MVRTHSSHTASPTRYRSAPHSPSRHPSQDGSQYEMDLDALGLNSTFETTELEGGHEPPVDRVDTSEVEGPEDFTMNMTYWMTADLPLAQIKSRKETARRSGPRMDASPEKEIKEVPEGTDQRRPAIITTTGQHDYGATPSERSMENDEKVRSFLSALPDTDMEGALTGTPMHAPRHSFLQVPQGSPPKARSLQPTVEDYDTPRKPTQETVIRHTSAIIDTSEQEVVRRQIEELQSQMALQQQASKERITELETILSYTRTELDDARNCNYRHKEALTSLQSSLQEKDAEHQATHAAAKAQRHSWEDGLTTKMEGFREEMRLNSLARLQSQQENFDRKLAELQSAKQLAEEEIATKNQRIENMEKELAQIKQCKDEQTQSVVVTAREAQAGHSCEQQHTTTANNLQETEQLLAVQLRAEELQRELERALIATRAAREDAQRKDAMRKAAKARINTLVSCVSGLEHDLQAARFEVECAQADMAAKQQLFNVNIDLNARVRALQSELRALQQTQSLGHLQISTPEDIEKRIGSLQTQLRTARGDLAQKDQEIVSYIEAQERAEQRNNVAQGRIEGLEANHAMVRQQLADSHRDGAKARTETERYQQELEHAEERSREALVEADLRIADVEKKLSKIKEARVEAESRYKTLQMQHEDLIEGHEAIVSNLRDKTEDAVRKAGAMLEQERCEKRRILKELKSAREVTDKLRSDAAHAVTEEDSPDEDKNTFLPTSNTKATNAEINSLRDIIRRQVASVKSMTAEMSALRKENKKLASITEASFDQEATITELRARIRILETQNSGLELHLEQQRIDFDTINKSMDEKLAAVVSKVMKERAKMVVGKRDGQWAETVGKVQGEKELLGKVLLRQWGREEIGIADERRGERQAYAYKYI